LTGQPELGGTNAAPVIADADQIEAATPEIDADAGRARVERILDQLLDDRSRPLNRLPRGNPGCDSRRQNPDASRACQFPRRRNVELASHEWRVQQAIRTGKVALHRSRTQFARDYRVDR
jgi:hypothetical protein